MTPDKEPPQYFTWGVLVEKNGMLIDKLDLSSRVSTVVGRKSADIILDHQSISRRHACLFYGKGGSLFIQCLGSSHGTKLNSSAVPITPKEAVELKPGDIIHFGKSSRNYRVERVRKNAQSAHEQQERGGLVVDRRTDDAAEGDGSEGSSSDDDFGPQLLQAHADTSAENSTRAKAKRPRSPESEVVADARPSKSGVLGREPLALAIHKPNTLEIPVSNVVDLEGHSKAVTCISVEAAGNRVLTSSLDCSLLFFDFAGMDSSQRPFRQIIPQSGIGVNCAVHSPRNDRILVVLSNSQPVVLDREGADILKFAKGDMYLHDLSHTKGHVTETTGGCWHPSEKSTVLTSSHDGTVRTWDLTSPLRLGALQCKTVFKVRSAPGAPQMRVGVSSCAFSTDGKYVFAGCVDGSVHIWDSKLHTRTKAVWRPYVSSGQSFPISHIMTSAVAFPNTTAYKNMVFCVGQDGCVFSYLADVLASDSKTAQAAEPHLTIRGSGSGVNMPSNIAINPEAGIACIPLNFQSAASGKQSKLRFYALSSSVSSPTPLLEVELEGSQHVSFVSWVTSTRQIFVATESGAVKAFFDPELSAKGVLLSRDRSRPKHALEGIGDAVATPWQPKKFSTSDSNGQIGVAIPPKKVHVSEETRKSSCITEITPHRK